MQVAFLRIRSFIATYKIEIKKHFLGWCIFYVIDFGFVLGFEDRTGFEFYANYFSSAFLYILTFYTVVSIYVKFLPKKPLIGLPLAVFIIMTSALVNCLWQIYIIEYERAVDSLKNLKENTFVRFFVFEVWRFSTSGLYAFAYWIYLQRTQEQNLRIITEKQLFRTELNFLKAQINPHFLFNTLNFVYGDVAPKSERAGKAILKLTNLMRYSVESTKNEKSNLKKEVDAIDEYIELQKIRFQDKVCVQFVKAGLFPFFALPPLVLMSIVENAFKYGVIDDPKNPIDISLKVSQEDMLFKCRNLKRKDFADRETTAVGVANIKRRLSMLYEKSFELTVNDTEDFYEVNLSVVWQK